MKTKLSFIILSLIGLFCFGSISAQDTSTSKEPIKKEALFEVEETYKDFRFAIGGGYAHRLGKILKTGDSRLDNFSSDLRGGYNIDLDAQYFFKEHWGLGLNLNYVSANAKTFDMEETDRFIYIGPTFSVRYEFNQFLLIMSAGFGPMFFNAKGNLEGYQASFNRTVFASQASISLEYKVSKQIGIGAKIGVSGGTMKIDGIDDRLSASNFLIGGFVSFKSW